MLTIGQLWAQVWVRMVLDSEDDSQVFGAAKPGWRQAWRIRREARRRWRATRKNGALMVLPPGALTPVWERMNQVAEALTVALGCPVSVYVHREALWANLTIETDPEGDARFPSAPGKQPSLVWTSPVHGSHPVGWAWDMTPDAPEATLVGLLAPDRMSGVGPDATPDEVVAAVLAARTAR